MKSKKPDNKPHPIEATLKRAAQQGWKNIAPDAAARRDLLPPIVEWISGEVERHIAKPRPQDTAHDRLFEIIMARLDILQSYRPAIRSIMDEARRDPHSLLILAKSQTQAMAQMLKLAGLSYDGPRQMAACMGLSAIYAGVLCAWRRDDSDDMAKTMALLDKALRRAGRVAGFILGQNAQAA